MTTRRKILNDAIVARLAILDRIPDGKILTSREVAERLRMPLGTVAFVRSRHATKGKKPGTIVVDEKLRAYIERYKAPLRDIDDLERKPRQKADGGDGQSGEPIFSLEATPEPTLFPDERTILRDLSDIETGLASIAALVAHVKRQAVEIEELRAKLRGIL